MYLACAIVKLENPQEEFRTHFESESRRGGMPFIKVQNNAGDYIYFFMNITQKDAQCHFDAFKIHSFIYLQQKHFKSFNGDSFGISENLSELSG